MAFYAPQAVAFPAAAFAQPAAAAYAVQQGYPAQYAQQPDLQQQAQQYAQQQQQLQQQQQPQMQQAAAAYGQQMQPQAYAQQFAQQQPQGYAQQFAQQPQAQPQAQTYGQPYTQPQAQAQPVQTGGKLYVSGCSNATVGDIIRGEYAPFTENHGRTVYRRSEQVNGLDVLIYFWDERDGPAFCGWWFGPKVGGDQVWAYNSDRGMAPPPSMWRVPYDGPVDATFVVQSAGQAALTDYGQQGFQQQGYQQQAQQQPQQGFQQGSYSGQGYSQQQQQQQQPAQQQQSQQPPYDPQADWRRQQEEQAARQAQEAKQRALQAQQQELQRQDMERRRRDEEKQRQEEERKRQEEEMRRKEQLAVSNVRKAIQQLRITSTQDEHDRARASVIEALNREGYACGSMERTVRDEAEKASAQSQDRITTMIRQKEEEERRRQELKVLAADSLKELDELVTAAEGRVATLKEQVAPVLSNGGLTSDSITSAMAQMADVQGDAKTACKACTDLLVSKKPVLDEARSLAVGEIAAQQLSIQAKIHECLKALVSSVADLQAAKGKAERKEKAATQLAKRDALFKRYDVNGDGFLNAKEISEYALKEFSFTMPEPALQKLLMLYGTAGKGVSKDDFAHVKFAVGIAREEAASHSRKEEAEKRVKLVEAEKVTLQEKLDALGKTLEATENSVSAAEASIRDLPAEVMQVLNSNSPSFDAIKQVNVKEIAAKSDATLEAAKAAVAKDKDEIVAFEKADIFAENKAFAQGGLRQNSGRVDIINARITRVNLTSLKLNDVLKKQEFLLLAQLRAEVSATLIDHYKAAATTSADFFGTIDLDKDDSIIGTEFVAAIKGTGKAPESLSDDKLTRLFADLAGEKMSKETFQQLGKTYYKVLHPTLLQETKAVEEETITIRRLEAGEVFEAETAAEKLESGIVRIEGRAVKDGAKGFASIVGNENTTFLAEGGNVVKAATQADLQNSAAAEGAAQVRALRPSELLQVLLVEAKSETGVVKVKVKAQSDGAVGWATWFGGDGRSLLQVV